MKKTKHQETFQIWTWRMETSAGAEDEQWTTAEENRRKTNNTGDTEKEKKKLVRTLTVQGKRKKTKQTTWHYCGGQIVCWDGKKFVKSGEMDRV